MFAVQPSANEKVVVAFSGGVDSALLLKAGYDALGDNVIAITANSAVFPQNENNEAEDFLHEIGFEFVSLDLQGYVMGSFKVDMN